jgi:hypothetical protein
MVIMSARHILMPLLGLSALLFFSSCSERSGPAPSEQASAGDSAEMKVDRKKMRSRDNIPFEHSWDLRLPKPVHTSWISKSIPEMIFFQLEDSAEIYGVDAMSGNTRWVTQPLPKPVTLPPFAIRNVMYGAKAEEFINDDRLYVISDDTLFCFDAVYGQLIWRFELPFSASSGPMAVGTEGDARIYIGDWSGRVQVVGYNVEKQFPYILWQWNLRTAVTASSVEKDGLVYTGDQGGSLSCFRLDRERSWHFPGGGAIFGSPLATERYVYFGTQSNTFYSLNRLSGEQSGSLYLNAPVKRAPFMFNGEGNRLYAWTTDRNRARGGLHAIRAEKDMLDPLESEKSKQRIKREIERISIDWFVPGASALVCSTPEHLYVMSEDSWVVSAVDRVSGEVDWAWDLNSGRSGGREVAHVTQYQDPTDLNRSIYTIDDDGRVDAYRLFGYNTKDRATLAAKASARAQAKKAAVEEAAVPAE